MMNTDSDIRRRAEKILADMTIEEKMAQVTCVFPFDVKFRDMDWIREQVPFGIGEVSTLEMRRCHTREEAAHWQRDVQKIVMEQSPHHIPAIFHMEGLCGAFIQDTTSFPSGIARGASFDPAVEKRIAGVVARQEASCGITHILAPVLDVSRDPRMGRQGESYGEDPTLAAVMGTAFTEGIQTTAAGGRHPESVAKHFVAFHNSEGGIHGAASDTPLHLLREVYAKPFQAAITDADLKGVMPCYCTIDGEPVSVSRTMLDDLLRSEMGFSGLCVSDYGAIANSHTVQHIGEQTADAGFLAMKAGVDVEMPSPEGYGRELCSRYKAGKIPIEILDTLVLRVLRAKLRMGLFEHPFAEDGPELWKAICGHPEDSEVSTESAAESLVLLKNNGVLPIQRAKKIAVIGPHADNPRMYFGGYTHMTMMESTLAVANSIAGVAGIPGSEGKKVRTIPGTSVQSDEGREFDEILQRQKPFCTSLLTELKKLLPDTEVTYAYGYPVAGQDESGFPEAMEAAEGADLVILTLGGKYGTCSMATMGEGVDSTDIGLPECQEKCIEKLWKPERPMIGLHFGGRPVSSDTADRRLSAILECWAPAESGGKVIAETLLGIRCPGGRMPVSVARSAGQIPVYYNHPWGSQTHQGESIGFANYIDMPHSPRYCFGYGLSYTDFVYENLCLRRCGASEADEGNGVSLKPEEQLEISFTVKNTGRYEGDEVAQLYLSDWYASRTRPVKELEGFCRLHLKPGETKKVIFMVDPSLMAFTDSRMKWKIEKGEFRIGIGSSSEDIRLKGKYFITENKWIEGRNRQMAADVRSLSV